MSSNSLAPVMDSAEKIEDAAAAWLWKRASNTWSDIDQVALDVWLAQSYAHQGAFWRLEAVWERTERLVALRPPGTRVNTKKSNSRLWVLLSGIAAVAIGVVVLDLPRNVLWPHPQQMFSTAVGGRATIKLSDGSRVELNTDTTLSANMTTHARTITLLRGEAYFQVQHNSARPFVVLAAGHRIVDLGTKFSVRNTGDGLKVMLVEGLARLETANSAEQPHSIDLTPGEVVVATANSLSVSKKNTVDVADALSWKRGLIVFKHTTLADAAREFNRYNRSKIIVSSNIAALRINGTFTADSIEAFTRMAQFAMGLHAEKSSERIFLSR